MSNADQATDVDDTRALVALCRKGRLYDIEKWIAAGKSLDISAVTKRGRQRSLLEIAVETGFHSLVEMIAKHEGQLAKDAALVDAGHRADSIWWNCYWPVAPMLNLFLL